MKYITNSEMKQWRRCKRAWYLSHHRGLRRKHAVDFNRPIGIGNRVHDALAAYYDPHDRIDPVQFIRDTIESDIDHFPAYEDDIVAEGRLATIMMEGYVQWCEETGADVGMELLRAESASSFEIHPGTRLLTKMDAQVRMPDGSRLNLEHKTTPSLTIALPTLQLDTQCLTEHLVEYMDLLEQGETDDRASGTLYNLLRKVKRTAAAKPPFFSRIPVRHNIHELRSHWKHVVAIITEMEEAIARLDAGEDHHDVCHPSPTRDCSWDCAFFTICPLFDDGSDVEGAIEEMYEAGDPLQRYAGLLQKEKDAIHENVNAYDPAAW